MTNNRTKILASVLIQLLAATGVELFAKKADGQEPETALPNVVAIRVPAYPQAARAVRLEGAVRIKVTTDGQRVATTEILEGPKLLAIPTQDNIQAWQFSPHDPTSFVVTFRYKLILAATHNTLPPAVILRLPKDVEISAFPLEFKDPSPSKNSKGNINRHINTASSQTGGRVAHSIGGWHTRSESPKMNE